MVTSTQEEIQASESIAFHGKSKTVSSIIDQKGINSRTYYPATPNGDEDEAEEDREMRKDEKNLHETLDTTHTDDGKDHQQQQKWAYPNASGKDKQEKVARDDLKVTASTAASPLNYHPSSPWRSNPSTVSSLAKDVTGKNASTYPTGVLGGGEMVKKVIIITCRSIPCESPASIVCQGEY